MAIVGGGIVGLATARKLILENPKLNFILVEKENQLCNLQRGERGWECRFKQKNDIFQVCVRFFIKLFTKLAITVAWYMRAYTTHRAR